MTEQEQRREVQQMFEKHLAWLENEVRHQFAVKWHHLFGSGGIDPEKALEMNYAYATVVLKLVADDLRLWRGYQADLNNLSKF